MPTTVKTIKADAFKNRPASAEEKILDVREPAEFASEAVPGSVNVPLSRLEKGAPGIPKTAPLYLICRSGMRSMKAAESLQKMGYENLCVVEGGLEACKACGTEVRMGSAKVWSLERQVRFAAGFLVLMGLLYGYKIHPAFYLLSAFVGAGLIFAAVTDTCGMAMILARMPWNQKKDEKGSVS